MTNHPQYEMPMEDVEREVLTLAGTLVVLGALTPVTYLFTLYMERAILRLWRSRIAAHKGKLYLNDYTREE